MPVTILFSENCDEVYSGRCLRHFGWNCCPEHASCWRWQVSLKRRSTWTSKISEDSSLRLSSSWNLVARTFGLTFTAVFYITSLHLPLQFLILWLTDVIWVPVLLGNFKTDFVFFVVNAFVIFTERDCRRALELIWRGENFTARNGRKFPT